MLDVLKIDPTAVRQWLADVLETNIGKNWAWEDSSLTVCTCGDLDPEAVAAELLHEHDPEWMEKQIRTYHRYRTPDYKGDTK